MAITNYDRVGKAMELLKDGLVPFVERELKAQYAQQWIEEAKTSVSDTQAKLFITQDQPQWDIASILSVIWNKWELVFRKTLGRAERSIVSELREVRNKWAHQNPFSGDDADRALDSAERLLSAVSAPQADDVRKIKMELRRTIYDEQVRTEKRKSAGAAIESAATTSLKPWREVVMPHKDVASGRYSQAEFAADLWQVHMNEGSDEYRDPSEFFRRTYLTESLKAMLVNAVQRLSGKSGDPVIQLQTNFGGGKTHSMMALYHLFSGIAPTDLAGVDAVIQSADASKLPSVRRVVLVGNKISPGNPVKKADGTMVKTLWGELAWQLGGRPAFDRVAADDEKATSPGDVLRELFKEYGPCLILIDEWVAYARQLHDQSDLPAGSFETQFTFAQVLTESAKLSPSCLLVISLPASDGGPSPHTQADDVEVGGQRGRDALERLRNVVGRIESSWRPASAEEGFEIVRRRLFQPMTDSAQFRDRDVVARAFADFYKAQQSEFPPECREAEYEKRIKAAYPIHPEVFDRLYTDWSTLVKFQRTRGVLRLMAAVIHSLWEKNDKNPLILPANIAMDDPRVQSELTRYLTDHWVPIIEKDVDGPGSLPLRLDSELPNLGKFAACRRVARTIYLGSAPLTKAAHRGVEDRRVKLGCVMPGESPSVFGDALRRLAGSATYLYQDGPHYWYSTQPTVLKLAEDRSEQIKRDPDKVAREVENRLRKDLEKKGEFCRVHPLPKTGQDIPDDPDARLIVLGIEYPYSKGDANEAQKAAQNILELRGTAPRLYRNSLVFLAADKTRLQDLEDAVSKYLAWESIVAEKLPLNLDPQQVRQAENQKNAADMAVSARLPETYQWLLVPEQKTPQDVMTWQAIRLTGQDALAVRAGKKLKNDMLLNPTYAGTLLRMDLDNIPLWRGNHVLIRQLADDFARYTYLPRLKDSSVLIAAIRDGLGLLTWMQESFAYADSYDDISGRYRGLRGGQGLSLLDSDTSGLLVKSEIAVRQIDAEKQKAAGEKTRESGHETTGTKGEEKKKEDSDRTSKAVQPKRFHGTVALDATRVGRDAGRIAEEVISHLAGMVNAKVTVTLEIEAEIPDGAPDQVVRTVTENSRTLKFSSQGFEKE
jgi:predicted AAA+ superfamily ATPase